MKFLDLARVTIRSGSGGAGCVSFRREKFIEFGGPDGGDGGRGGALIFEATTHRNTLIDYRRYRHQRAGDGVRGGRRQMNGAAGKPKHCPVPVGTAIYNADTGELLADLAQEGARWELPGGDGGLGNVHFKSSTNRTPRKATPGWPGAELRLRLELKLLADLGLLGFPNAGKSTFLGRVSAARPKVADYPFTTLVPQLGVVPREDAQAFVIADIPGLIEGAAEGAGLGHRFLKHVERCAGYIHLVAPYDGPEDVAHRFGALNAELLAYAESHDASLAKRPQLVVLTKVDTLSDDERAALVAELQQVAGSRVFPISCVTGEGVEDLLHAAWSLVQSQRAEAAKAPPAEAPVAGLSPTPPAHVEAEAPTAEAPPSSVWDD